MANLIASLYYAVKLRPYPRPFFSALTENSLRSSHHDNAQLLFPIRFERTANLDAFSRFFFIPKRVSQTNKYSKVSEVSAFTVQ